MINALKKAFFKGLVILIPLVLLWITIRELVELLVAFAEPIADALPAGSFEWVRNPELVAPLLIVFIALLLGALAAIPFIHRAGSWLEQNTIGQLPLYRMIKTFITAFLELEDAASFRPALIVDDEGGAEPCYIIEDRDNNERVVVLVPWSPASFAGSVKVVSNRRIRRLDITFDEFSLSLANFGLGMTELLEDQEGTTDARRQ
ncbi:MAG: DUF502 domain-containing protein [Gammaproteobacteria bacterium]|nr:DUF502 domain-containing protein [Gammaproteobacteria bacterium]MBT8056504.1 DUF502 domain-containing protein [Gammaproteobacteria bacterium]